MTINVRDKGANGERELCNILQPVVDSVAKAHGMEAPRLRRNLMQYSEGGEDIVGLPWYSIEVKRVEVLAVDKWWEQCVTQAARKAAGATSWDALARGGWRSLRTGGGSTPSTGARGETGAAGASNCGSDSPISGVLPAGAGNLLHPLPAGLARYLESVGGEGEVRTHAPSPNRPEGASGGEESRVPVLVYRQNSRKWRAVLLGGVQAAGGTWTRCRVDVSLDALLHWLEADLGARLDNAGNPP